MDELLLRNVRVVQDELLVPASILIVDGRIVAFLPPDTATTAARAIDGHRAIALPGLIDAHVHTCQPGRTTWEGFRAATRAAAAGGVTTIVDMPLSCTPTVTLQALEEKRSDIAPDALVDYALWGGLTADNVDQVPALIEGGVVGLKAFMTDSMQEFGWASDDVLLRGMKVAAGQGALVGVHAESEALVGPLTRRATETGSDSWSGYLSTRPPIAEIDASRRAIGFAGETGARLHIVHCSLPEVVDLVQKAKLANQDVSVETCPHYLSLTDADLARIGNDAKCSPPVRPRATVEQLWECILAGLIDTIGSDHAPSQPGLKEASVGPLAAGHGILGLQTMLPILLSEGVHQRGLPLSLLTELTATRPAKRFGLWPAKGSLRLGADGDVTLVDPDATWQFQARDMMYSVQRYNPWDGKTFQGRVVATYVRGRQVYSLADGPNEPGWGREVRSTIRTGVTI
ncbi:MAG TPA: allantoinase AllB [Chloroflexota bacterium]|nr:allantoinase AllB [Chloroflexota bacterium]